MKSAFTTLLIILSLCVSQAVAAQIIVIDPGHGGNDPGGTGNDMLEKAIVLDTSKRFEALLIADTADDSGGGSWSTHLTRDTDEFIALAARASYANSLDADRFLSIHANAFGSASANGTETFSYNEGTTSASLRDLVQEEMVDAWQLTNRGSKTANYSVLRNTAMPAELHELGFLTNSTDAIKLASADAHQNAALAHLHALQRHFGLDAFTPGSTTDPQDDPDVGTIEVHVSDSRGPLAGATISLDGIGQGQSDEDGILILLDVPAATYLVAASSPNHEESDTSAELHADENLSTELFLVRTNDVDAPGGANGEIMSDESGPLLGGCSSSQGQGGGFVISLFLALLWRSQRRKIRAIQS